LVGLLFLLMTATDAAAGVQHVLILQTFDRGTIVYDRFTQDFRRTLEERAPDPVTFTQIALAPAGFIDTPEESIVEFVSSLFANRAPPDLVVTVGGPAAAFGRKYRTQLFPNTPLLFGYTDPRFLGSRPLADNETSVSGVADYALIIDDILQLLPQTSQVFVVSGASPLSRFWRGELERSFGRFRDRVTFTWSNDLAYAKTLAQAASLPPHSAILYFMAGTDAEGAWHSDEELLTDLASQANAPMFGIQSVWLGLGIVGGRMLFVDGLGADAGDVAARILKGEPAGHIKRPPVLQGPSAFDARQLRRWNISESRLPPGSDVRFRPPTLWREYRSAVLTSVAIVATQSFLIIGLLYQRQARRRAELQSRRSLALAADANRRLTMTALTGSIAHELSQPLNAILHNAQAGEMLVKSERATPQALGEILADIRAADVRASQIIERHRSMLKTHQVEMKAIDMHAVVRDSLLLVAHDTRAKQVTIDVQLPPQPCMVLGDQVLLQQVLVNLLVNAIDAMATTPVDRRRITIDNVLLAEQLRLSVHDAGTGLPTELKRELFEPFVTTKAHGTGVGLTIVRTIVEAHGGTMTAENNATGGATFTISMPRQIATA